MNTWDAIKLGLLVALRSMMLPAVMSDYLASRRARQGDNILFNILATQEVAQLTKLMASGEVFADKTPFVPARTEWIPLLGRVSVAAALAAVLAQRGDRINAAAGAVAGAAVGSHLAYHLRKNAKDHFHLPDFAVALVEDSIVFSGAMNWRDEYAAAQLDVADES